MLLRRLVISQADELFYGNRKGLKLPAGTDRLVNVGSAPIYPRKTGSRKQLPADWASHIPLREKLHCH